MKNVKKVLIFLFSITVNLVSKSENLLEKFSLVLSSGIDTISFFNQLAEAEKKYNEKYTQEARIKCKNCSSLVTCGEVFGTIQASCLNNIINSKSDSYQDIKKILNKFIEAITTQTPTQVEEYTLSIAQQFNFSCKNCDQTMWVLNN